MDVKNIFFERNDDHFKIIYGSIIQFEFSLVLRDSKVGDCLEMIQFNCTLQNSEWLVNIPKVEHWNKNSSPWDINSWNHSTKKGKIHTCSVFCSTRTQVNILCLTDAGFLRKCFYTLLKSSLCLYCSEFINVTSSHKSIPSDGSQLPYARVKTKVNNTFIYMLLYKHEHTHTYANIPWHILDAMISLQMYCACCGNE